MDKHNINTDRDIIEYTLSILGQMQEGQKLEIVHGLEELPEQYATFYPLLEAVYVQTANDVRKFLDKMPGGFFIYQADENEDIIYANQALLWMFGCRTMEEFRKLTGNSFKGIVHPDDLEEVEKSIWEQVACSRNDLDYVEYRIIRRDGEIRWIEDYGHFVRSESAGDIFYVFVSDATEKKRKLLEERDALLQERLKVIHQEHMRRLEVIEGLSANYESILYADLESNEILPYRMSDRIQHHFTKKLEVKEYTDFIADYANTWVCKEDRENMAKILDPEYIKRRLAVSRTCFVNYRTMKDGEMQFLQLLIVDVGSREHAAQVVMGCQRVDDEIKYEMEQKKILEDALKEAKRANAAQNTFLSNMSHDMRTPLNAIIGFTALAKNHIDNQQKVEEYLEKIEMSGVRLMQLINNILEISKIESGNFQKKEEEFSLSDVMQEIYREIQPRAQAKGIAFSMDLLHLKNSNVCGDREKLRQVLLHLTGNAIKYTNREEGMVSLSVVEQKAVEDYMSYQFMVRDNGIGIKADYLEKIFEPFERVRNTTQSGIFGTGLGLTIAKRLVEMMGGKIRVHSTYGEGSSFIVTLNLRVKEKRTVTVEGTRETVMRLLDNRRVLLVDDNEINLEIASELLQDVGILVDKAENGSTAIEKLLSSGIEKYGLILMDIQMPVMNGYQAAKAIREMGNPALAHIPIIALSANAFEEDRRMSWESGMDAHMAKPFNMPELLELIADVLTGEKRDM